MVRNCNVIESSLVDFERQRTVTDCDLTNQITKDDKILIPDVKGQPNFQVCSEC